jgi:hypothetical protein
MSAGWYRLTDVLKSIPRSPVDAIHIVGSASPFKGLRKFRTTVLQRFVATKKPVERRPRWQTFFWSEYSRGVEEDLRKWSIALGKRRVTHYPWGRKTGATRGQPVDLAKLAKAAKKKYRSDFANLESLARKSSSVPLGAVSSSPCHICDKTGMLTDCKMLT